MTDNALATVHIDESAILRHLGLDPSNPAAQALVAVCRRYGLDPILKHMILIQGRPYVTRDGLLHVAHRSGKLDGIEVLEQTSDASHFVAKVAVYRKDMGRPFTYVGRYPKNGSNKLYGPEMAVKCAEVMSLRRAFDVAIAAQEERWDVEPDTAIDVQPVQRREDARPAPLQPSGGGEQAGEGSSSPPSGARDVAHIEVGGPCPHCGADVKRWAPKARDGEHQKKPQWLCTNRECPGSPDTQVAPRWFSWHDDPWKPGGEIDQMRSEAGVDEQVVTGPAANHSEPVRQSEGVPSTASSDVASDAESPESVFQRIDNWREANHVFKRQLFNVAKDVALEMKAREDGRPFHPKDIPSLPVEVLLEIEKRLHVEKADADAKAAEQESLGVG